MKEDSYKTIFMDIGFVNRFSQIGLTELDNLTTANEGMLPEQFVVLSIFGILFFNVVKPL